MVTRAIRLSLSVWLLLSGVAPAWAQETPTAGVTASPEITPTDPPTATPTALPSPTAPTPPAPPVFDVRLNEFLAAPGAGQEYVELFNRGPDPADISGWQIDDLAGGGGAPKIIPANTIIPPGGFWVLTFANFLNNSSDDVRLLDAGGAVVDSYSYSSFTVDYSTSRLPDGSGGWQDGTPPTPNAPNQALATPTPTEFPTATVGPTPPPTPIISPTVTPAPALIRLNEYLAAPSAGASEFVEVVNLGAETISLSGWKIRDASGNTRAFTLTALLPGQFYAHQFASGLLNNSGDAIELLDPGGAPIDATSYTGSQAGLSASRLPDGSGAWVPGTTPTPDAPNQPLPPPAVFTLRINEFLAAPISGTEFIELYNLGPDPASLSGWKIDDEPGGGAPKVLPANTIVPPGGFWVLSASSFLNNDSDAVRLLDPAGAVTDVYTYTAAVAGLSTSRLPDGIGAWADGTPLTPDAPNQPAPPPAVFTLRINEFLAAPISGTEFIELYNLGPDPASLSGWKIDDVADGGGAPHAIPAGTTIPPGGFWVLSTSSFLNNSGDSVNLIDASGAITDSASYTGTIEGMSASRLPDGVGAWADGTPLTPNAPNLPPPAPPSFRLVINEFLAAPFSGSGEFIELYNLGPDPANLSGWKIDDVADGGGAPHAIPAGTVIPAGSWWTWQIASAYLNNADDAVRLLDPAGAEVDAYQYSSSVAGMSASRLPDGVGAWADGTPPTPDAANRGPDALPTGIFLNEVFPHPPVGQREWIELYSTYTATVDLTGWLLDDAAGGSAPTVLPAGTTLAPGEWRQVLLSSNILNDGGDHVRLLAPDGSPIDTMSYGKTKKPTSWSRLPDGVGPWHSNTPPTPDAPNQPPPEAPATPEAQPGSAAASGSVLITEVVYDAPSDRDESANEWIEITNVTSATLLIDGWSLHDNKAASRIPSFSIAPAEVVVLAPSAELLQFFPSFSGTLILVGVGKIGNGLGNNGDQLLLIDGVGTAIDALSWGEITTVFDPAAPDVKTGHSLQRQPATADTDSAADWIDSPAPNPGSLAAGEAAAPPAPELDDGPPTTAEPHAILLTQVLYDPRSPIQEPGGEWIEIVNNSPLTQTLRGWSIGDTRASDLLPTLTLNPAEIVLIAAAQSISTTYTLSGQVVVLPDGAIGAGLNNGGDALALRDGAGTLIDALSWGDNTTALDPAAPDGPEGASLVREPPDSDTDSASDWTTQSNAQPSGSTLIDRPVWRLPADSSVILSEVLAAPKASDANGDGSIDRGDEWIELVNLSAEPIDLGGWIIDDLADGGSPPHVIAAGTLIAGDGFLVLSGATTNLGLNNSGLEQVRLLRPDGRLADLLEYRSTRPDRSWSRVPSPDGDWAGGSEPTPNAANSQTAGGAAGRPFGATVPIAALKTLPLTASVAISGVVTVRPSVLRKNALYVQDASAGVMILLKSNLEWPALEPGQQISLRGKLATFHGERQIKVNALADLVLGNVGRPVPPSSTRGAAITLGQVGQLVQVRGSYLKADGRDILIRASDGTTVRLHPPAGMKKPRYRKGAPISAVGIVGRYDATVRIQLRGLPDLGIVGGLPDTGDGAAQRREWRWLILLLLAAGLGLRVRAGRPARPRIHS